MFLFPDAYAWMVHRVIINHREPQQTADTANATWEAGTQLVSGRFMCWGKEVSSEVVCLASKTHRSIHGYFTTRT